MLRPTGIGEPDSDPSGLERRIQRAMLLADIDSALLGVAQEELVERCAEHLKGLRSGGLDGLREVRVLFHGAVEPGEARAPLPNEPGAGDRVVHTELPEDLVAPGELRFPDVKARKLLPLQEEDPAPLPRERSGGAGAAGAPTDDDGVEVPVAGRGHALGWDVSLQRASGSGSRWTARTGRSPWTRRGRCRAPRSTGRSRRRPPSCTARTRCARPGPSAGCPSAGGNGPETRSGSNGCSDAAAGRCPAAPAGAVGRRGAGPRGPPRRGPSS